MRPHWPPPAPRIGGHHRITNDSNESTSFRTDTKGLKGQERPADVIGNAVKVMQIATGEAEEEYDDDRKDKAAQALGQKGGRARANKLTAEQRAEIARKAA